MSILTFDDVVVAYGRTPILHEVSFEVPEGDIISLIGRNGVGKTTLMKTAIGLLSPQDGAITFKNTDVTAESADKRARMGMGYVPQGRDVFPKMTVKENLLIGSEVGGKERSNLFEEVYEYFPRLAERKGQKAGTMSGGEQQMLAIGRALVGNPDLLLLDEPSEGVQPSIVTEIGERVKEINRDIGTTILFVEQNLQFTVDTADDCYVMEKGEIVDRVPPNELEDSEIVEKYITV